MIAELITRLPFYPRIWAFFRLKNVPVDKIRCQVRPFSEQLGFSGRTLDYFPPCKFFMQYLSDPDQAYKDFSNWLYHSFIELEGWRIEKRDGGLKNGSMMRLIIEAHKDRGIELAGLNDASDEIIWEAIDKRVQHYLNLLESVKIKGFNRYLRPPIMVRNQQGLYYLIEGHHRASVLYALGYKKIPVYVSQRTV